MPQGSRCRRNRSVRRGCRPDRALGTSAAPSSSPRPRAKIRSRRSRGRPHRTTPGAGRRPRGEALHPAWLAHEQPIEQAVAGRRDGGGVSVHVGRGDRAVAEGAVDLAIRRLQRFAGCRHELESQSERARLREHRQRAVRGPCEEGRGTAGKRGQEQRVSLLGHPIDGVAGRALSGVFAPASIMPCTETTPAMRSRTPQS